MLLDSLHLQVKLSPTRNGKRVFCYWLCIFFFRSHVTNLLDKRKTLGIERENLNIVERQTICPFPCTEPNWKIRVSNLFDSINLGLQFEVFLNRTSSPNCIIQSKIHCLPMTTTLTSDQQFVLLLVYQSERLIALTSDLVIVSNKYVNYISTSMKPGLRPEQK